MLHNHVTCYSAAVAVLQLAREIHTRADRNMVSCLDLETIRNLKRILEIIGRVIYYLLLFSKLSSV